MTHRTPPLIQICSHPGAAQLARNVGPRSAAPRRPKLPQVIRARDGTDIAICCVMPVTLTVETDRRLVTTTGSGIVTDEEFVRARRELLEHPEFDSTYDRIWDFHGVTEARVTEDISAQLIASSPFSPSPICRAVVMSERSGPMKLIIDFISRTRQANRRIAAFPNRASAEKWVFTSRDDHPPEFLE